MNVCCLVRPFYRPGLNAQLDKDATNYFRAIVKSGERTERALELTEKVISMNPAHYSAWYVLFHLLHKTIATIDLWLFPEGNIVMRRYLL